MQGFKAQNCSYLWHEGCFFSFLGICCHPGQFAMHHTVTISLSTKQRSALMLHQDLVCPIFCFDIFMHRSDYQLWEVLYYTPWNTERCLQEREHLNSRFLMEQVGIAYSLIPEQSKTHWHHVCQKDFPSYLAWICPSTSKGQDTWKNQAETCWGTS